MRIIIIRKLSKVVCKRIVCFFTASRRASPALATESYMNNVNMRVTTLYLCQITELNQGDVIPSPLFYWSEASY